METGPDNLLCANNCNKVSTYLNVTGNPFTKLANMHDDIRRVNLSTKAGLLYYKIINCLQHRITALMLNSDNLKNNWKLLEILYDYLFNIYGKHLQLWTTVTMELEDCFDKGINSKIDILTYSTLTNILTYLNDKIERKFVLSQKNNISWTDIYTIFLNIIALFPERQCSCNDYVNYPPYFLTELKISYPRINLENLENILNNIPINYESINFEREYINNITEALRHKIPRPKIVGNIKLSYDFLPESQRLDFIYFTIKNKTILNKVYNIKNETYSVFRILNKCFICDIDVTETHYNTHIKDGHICEQISKNKSDTIYPIIHRCLKCREESYGKLLNSNNDCIMARHYKWMMFYLGHQTTLLYVPKDVLWLIIIKYLYIRCT